jgi:peptide-methionine (S)-S-oxide reductase
MITGLALMLLGQGAAAKTPWKQATFAGGCFWCVEAIFQELDGVENVTAGMMGGQDEGLTAEQIARGEGGHAEVIFLVYDPAVISYTQLLEVFFATHDPTSVNKQGDDEGVEYRSAIFTYDDTQMSLAKGVIAELTREGVYDKPIVTEVTPATRFHAAAEKHQDYYSKQSDPAYCQRVITPKVEKFRKIFADRLKKTR